jgi:hypothetical protein
MYLENNSASNPLHMSYLFASRFQKIYNRLSNSNIPDLSYIENQFNISNIILTPEDIYKNLISINCNKGAGPDEIPPVFYKNCAENLVAPLSILFNKSLMSGIFPNIWKKSYLTPIFKSGERNNVSNYRGILSTLPNFFEKLVCEKLYELLPSNIHNEQHGFMQKRSINSNLMIYTKFIFDAFEKHIQIDKNT